MIPVLGYAGARVAVLGLGRSGLSAARALVQGGATALCWGLLMLFLLADDALWLHERYGASLAETLGLPAIGGLQAADLGELVYAGGITAVLAVGVHEVIAASSCEFTSYAASW